MTAAATNRMVEGRTYTGKSNLAHGVTASAHLYRNTLAVIDITTGLLVSFASYSANYRFVGITLREVYNLATAQAHIKGDQMPVATEGTLVLVCSGADITWTGKAVSAIDDQTVRLMTGSSDTYVGRVIRYISSTSVEVEIDVDQSAFVIA